LNKTFTASWRPTENRLSRRRGPAAAETAPLRATLPDFRSLKLEAFLEKRGG